MLLMRIVFRQLQARLATRRMVLVRKMMTRFSGRLTHQQKRPVNAFRNSLVVSTEEPVVEEKSNGNVKKKKNLVDMAKEYLKKGVGPKEMMASLSGSPQENASALYWMEWRKGMQKHALKKKTYLAAVVDGEGDSQLLLLRAIEDFRDKSNSIAVKEVPLVLKALYDVDILEEEYIVKWYEEGLSGGNKSSLIWKNAKPFVEWLQSAESETEEE